MSEDLEKLAELAEQFLIKIAEHHYEENAPPNVKADDLDWIDDQTRAEIKFNGKSPIYQPFDKSHNPPSMIADEKIWNRAKKVIKKYWHQYEEPWATTMHIYKSMGGKIHHKKKHK